MDNDGGDGGHNGQEQEQEQEQRPTLECGTSLAEWEYNDDGGSACNSDSSAAAPADAPHGTAATTPGADAIIEAIRTSLSNDIVGSGMAVTSPFPSPHSPSNQRTNLQVPLVYCDYTASSRPVQSIEDYIHRTCLPLYGNTHTNTSITGSQSTAFVAEARQIVAECTNARITGKASTDVVMFVGSGATSAVELLVDILGIKNRTVGGSDRPVVFVGPFEHHSNLLPWRESGCEVVFVPECPVTGDVDLAALEKLLDCPEYGGKGESSSSDLHGQRRRRPRLRMGAFSAASNVTGRTTDVDAVTALLHRHGALAFWDYATGAAYLPMDMNPPTKVVPATINDGGSNSTEQQQMQQLSASLLSKDAMFISPHKMLGGPGAPGILVVKKRLVSQFNPPSRCGGGTVFYVTHDSHRFLSNRVERYEGGTPNIPGIVRAGLTFLLKRRTVEQFRRCHRVPSSLDSSRTTPDASKLVGGSATTESTSRPFSPLATYEFDTWDMVVDTLAETAPNLIMLGTSTREAEEHRQPNLPIFSFLIRCGRRFLHYNFVCALLNDLFGIQSRGGCQCAGPYSQRLLGLTTNSSSAPPRSGSTAGGVPVQVPNEANWRVETALVGDKAELLRPGFTRLSLPFCLQEEEVQYVLKALAWVAKYGWVFLPQYRCNHRTGEWRHHSRQGRPLGKSRLWLSHYTSPYEPMQQSTPLTSLDTAHGSQVGKDEPCGMLKDCLDEALFNAEVLLEQTRKDHKTISQALNLNDGDEILSDRLEELRWYVYPKECARWLHEGYGIEEISSCVEGGLLGVLRPVECCLGKLFSANDQLARFVASSSVSAKDSSEGNHEMLAASTLVVSKESEHAVVTEPVSEFCEALEDRRFDSNGQFFFREGDHSGEATFAEIKEGFDDGELTDECEIYNSEVDGWISMAEFLSDDVKWRPSDEPKVRNAERTATADVVEPLSELFSIGDKPAMESAGLHQEKKQKKPSRDSSVWGHSHQEADVLPPAQDETDSRFSETAHISSSPSVSATSSLPRRIKPPNKLMRSITQAMLQWNMLEEGDSLLLGLSGGKDSLSLLHCLLEFQRKLPIKFTIQVCTIDPMTESFDPSPLIPYVRDALGLQYHYVRDDIVSRANTSGKSGQVVSSLCSFCSRMKRGNLYKCARENGCNKLVLAQHLDDLAESFMMSVMHNGFVRTMKAHYKINAGDLAVIRPLVYCRESLMTEFAVSAGLPVINENCPACFEEPKERARMKKLLSREETLYPHLYDNIRKALIPLMHEDSTPIMRCYTEEALAKSRKEQGKGRKKKGQRDKRNKAHDRECAHRSEEVKKDNCRNISQSANQEELGSPLSAHSALKEKLNVTENESQRDCVLLAEASEEQLITELARRRKQKYQLFGAMKYKADYDPTGQVCSLDGRGGTIPCRELME